MAIQDINKYIKIVDNLYLRVTKRFAENNLSKCCLKYAEEVNSKYYIWSFEDFAYCVIFELPSCFDMSFEELVQKMGIFCIDYEREKKVETWLSFKDAYIKNRDRKLIY